MSTKVELKLPVVASQLTILDAFSAKRFNDFLEAYIDHKLQPECNKKDAESLRSKLNDVEVAITFYVNKLIDDIREIGKKFNTKLQEYQKRQIDAASERRFSIIVDRAERETHNRAGWNTLAEEYRNNTSYILLKIGLDGTPHTCANDIVPDDKFKAVTKLWEEKNNLLKVIKNIYQIYNYDPSIYMDITENTVQHHSFSRLPVAPFEPYFDRKNNIETTTTTTMEKEDVACKFVRNAVAKRYMIAKVVLEIPMCEFINKSYMGVTILNVRTNLMKKLNNTKGVNYDVYHYRSVPSKLVQEGKEFTVINMQIGVMKELEETIPSVKLTDEEADNLVRGPIAANGNVKVHKDISIVPYDEDENKKLVNQFIIEQLNCMENVPQNIRDQANFVETYSENTIPIKDGKVQVNEVKKRLRSQEFWIKSYTMLTETSIPTCGTDIMVKIDDNVTTCVETKKLLANLNEKKRAELPPEKRADYKPYTTGTQVTKDEANLYAEKIKQQLFKMYKDFVTLIDTLQMMVSTLNEATQTIDAPNEQLVNGINEFVKTTEEIVKQSHLCLIVKQGIDVVDIASSCSGNMLTFYKNTKSKFDSLAKKYTSLMNSIDEMKKGATVTRRMIGAAASAFRTAFDWSKNALYSLWKTFWNFSMRTKIIVVVILVSTLIVFFLWWNPAFLAFINTSVNLSITKIKNSILNMLSSAFGDYCTLGRMGNVQKIATSVIGVAILKFVGRDRIIGWTKTVLQVMANLLGYVSPGFKNAVNKLLEKLNDPSQTYDLSNETLTQKINDNDAKELPKTETKWTAFFSWLYNFGLGTIIWYLVSTLVSLFLSIVSSFICPKPCTALDLFAREMSPHPEVFPELGFSAVEEGYSTWDDAHSTWVDFFGTTADEIWENRMTPNPELYGETWKWESNFALDDPTSSWEEAAFNYQLGNQAYQSGGATPWASWGVMMFSASQGAATLYNIFGSFL